MKMIKLSLIFIAGNENNKNIEKLVVLNSFFSFNSL